MTDKIKYDENILTGEGKKYYSILTPKEEESTVFS